MDIQGCYTSNHMYQHSILSLVDKIYFHINIHNYYSSILYFLDTLLNFHNTRIRMFFHQEFRLPCSQDSHKNMLDTKTNEFLDINSHI